MPPAGHLVGGDVGPEAGFLFSSEGLELFVFIIEAVFEARIGVGVTFGQESFVEK